MCPLPASSPIAMPIKKSDRSTAAVKIYHPTKDYLRTENGEDLRAEDSKHIILE